MELKMKIALYTYITILGIIFIQSCSEPYVPNTFEEDQQFVVEGFVEAGNDAAPAYVIITKSIPFISEIDQSTFESLFIDTAEVFVYDGLMTTQLTKLCTQDPSLPDFIKEAIADFLGISIDDMSSNICVYVDIFDNVTREIGRTYDLSITIGDHEITGTTSIVRHNPLFDLIWEDPPGEPNDSLAQLMVSIADKEGEDYYRYLTATGDRRLVAPFQSTTNDIFFDGQDFEFPLNKAEYPEDDIDFNTFGLYTRGDSVEIKWMNIDKAHFDFWNTRDFSSNNNGPFSSYTRITGNLNGALGIWGGYSSSTYKLYCPPK